MKLEYNKRDEFIKSTCVEQECYFWGTSYKITPQLVEHIWGDGLQVIYLTPIDTRPNYYVLRIDSKTDISSDQFDWNDLLNMVGEEFGEASDYDEHFDEASGEHFYTYQSETERLPESTTDFPMLSWGGGTWGTLNNFKS